jgi:hypothetical protein
MGRPPFGELYHFFTVSLPRIEDGGGKDRLAIPILDLVVVLNSLFVVH